ncbi:MAG: hypothetical protein ABUK01_13670, partial [Leptospirales bacterium]
NFRYTIFIFYARLTAGEVSLFFFHKKKSNQKAWFPFAKPARPYNLTRPLSVASAKNAHSCRHPICNHGGGIGNIEHPGIGSAECFFRGFAVYINSSLLLFLLELGFHVCKVEVQVSINA